eukprot:scaffold124952_cov20-Prasinocladus_malaysianus.AAC.1
MQCSSSWRLDILPPSNDSGSTSSSKPSSTVVKQAVAPKTPNTPNLSRPISSTQSGFKDKRLIIRHKEAIYAASQKSGGPYAGRELLATAHSRHHHPVDSYMMAKPFRVIRDQHYGRIYDGSRSRNPS